MNKKQVYVNLGENLYKEEYVDACIAVWAREGGNLHTVLGNEK